MAFRLVFGILDGEGVGIWTRGNMSEVKSFS